MTLPGVASTAGASNTISVSAVTLSTLMSHGYSSLPLTTIQTIVELSFMTSATVSASSSSLSATSSASPQLSAQQMSSSASTTLTHHQKLVIILSCIFGFLGLLLIAGMVVLIIRYCRQQPPFSHRGASPIDDEEIASWRRSEQEKRQPDLPSEHKVAIRDMPALPHQHQAAWSWATTPSSGSIHTIRSPFPDSPSYVATAPNARVGLTDETIPGAVPFIPPPKRRNSRLSKLPHSHSRTRSRRSSFSAKSMLSAQGHNRVSSDLKMSDRAPVAWYEVHDDPLDSQGGACLKEIGMAIESPRISVFDETTPSGGLSPRPRSVVRITTWERNDDIGRAIA